MKTAMQSTTVRSFGALALGAILALVLHYTGTSVLDPATLGGAWTTLVTSILGVIQRYRTSTPMAPLRRPPGPPVELPTDESGRVEVDFLGGLVVVALVVSLALFGLGALVGQSGCGAATHTLEPGQTPGVDLRLGPPAYGAVTADGEPVCTMTHPTRAFDLSPDAAMCELLCGDEGAP